MPATPATAPKVGPPQVVVVGEHPAASLCAILLKQAKVEVALCKGDGLPNAGRLVTLNPAFFGLHPLLEPLRGTLDLAPLRRCRFLGPDGQTADSRAGEGVEAVLGYVAAMDEVAAAVRQLAVGEGVTLLDGAASVGRVDENGVELTVGRRTLSPQILCVSDPLDAASTAALGASPWPGNAAQRQTCAKLVGGDVLGDAAVPDLLAMSLDLGGELDWGWLLARGEEVQICVQGPASGDAGALLEEWAALLAGAGVLAAGARADGRTHRGQLLPLAGAMTRDVVARRTLLLGPAGGFYSASGEDVYPCCWSAQFAADAAAKALKAPQVQDALGAYRGKWGATLGEYLRGPQQNLRFLLPLVYKNPTMTDRLAEAILLGRSLVK